jgi:hypothetical protein
MRNGECGKIGAGNQSGELVGACALVGDDKERPNKIAIVSEDITVQIEDNSYRLH